MNLEARSWLVDFHAAAALDSFSFFWVFLLGLFLVFSDFKRRVWRVSYLIGLGSLVPLVCFFAYLFFPSCRPPPVSAGSWSR